MAVDPRVTEFRDACVRILRGRPVGYAADLDYTNAAPYPVLKTEWCEERANQMATVLQGLLGPTANDGGEQT